MKEINIGGKKEIIKLNNHDVVVALPKKELSFEEGVKEINKFVSKIKKR